MILEIDITYELRGCLFTGAGRGDCEHYVGLPDEENENTTDEYGRPHGWCEVCWRGEQIRRVSQVLYDVTLNYGGQAYAQSILNEARKRQLISRESK